MMKLIDNWQSKHYKCRFCGTDKSVKYEADFALHKVHVCNKCVLIHLRDGEQIEYKEK